MIRSVRVFAMTLNRVVCLLLLASSIVTITVEGHVFMGSQGEARRRKLPPKRSDLHQQPPSFQSSSRGGEFYACRKVSPRVCEVESGQRVDLTSLGNRDGTPRFSDVPDPSGLYTYSWNPCFPFSQGSCVDVSVCQTTLGTSATSVLGNQSVVDFDISSSQGMMIVYIGEAGWSIALRTTHIRLQCDPEVEADFSSQGEIIPLSGYYYFTLKSRYACLINQPSSTTLPTVPSVVTITPNPTSGPIYNLKTVVDLLFVLTLVVVLVLVVLVLLFVVICIRKGLTKSCSTDNIAGKKGHFSLSDLAWDKVTCSLHGFSDKKQLLQV